MLIRTTQAVICTAINHSFPLSLPRFKRRTKGFTTYDHVARYLPALAWLKTYNWKGWFYVSVTR